MAAVDPYWSGPGYVAWRTGAKLLPHGQDNASIDRIRQVSASLSDSDPGFRKLRAKIHGAPDGSDADRVRQYATNSAPADKAAAYEQLADEIDAVYQGASLADRLEAFLDTNPPEALAHRIEAAAAPVRGILTAGEGNPLSHVQLLARNLGIPNATVNENLLPDLRAHEGNNVVLAVSAAGLVELAADGPRWNDVFGDDTQTSESMIKPDLEKLDLGNNVRAAAASQRPACRRAYSVAITWS